MNTATVLAPKQALTKLQAIIWGGPIAGTLDVTNFNSDSTVTI